MPLDNKVRTQAQTSLTDQLLELKKLAIENGLYDADDWLVRNFFEKTQKTADMVDEEEKVINTIKARAKEFVLDNFTNPSEQDFLVIESAMLVGASIRTEVEMGEPEMNNNKQAAPGDENIERDQPANQPDPAPQPEVPQVTPPVPSMNEEEETEEQKLTRWHDQLDSELSNEQTVLSVIEFLKEENYDLDEVKVEEGFNGWGQGTDMATITLGHKEYYVSPTEDDAEALAKAIVLQDLEHEPEIFNQDWLQSYIDEEKLRRTLHSDVYDMIYESPDSYGWEADTQRYDAEGNEDDEGEFDSNGNAFEEDAEPSDEWIESKVAEILRDPVDYLADIYGKEDAAKEAIRMVGIDVDAAADDAIAADGWAHFLSTYDGEYHELPSGGVWWRHN